jgi:hypothetical protein
MNGHSNNRHQSYSAQWSIYANPELLRVSVQRAEDRGWIMVTLESEPEDVEVGTTNDIPHVSAEAESEEPKLHKLSLKLRLEEIPRLVAVLNEVYLNNHEEAVQTIEFDDTEEWGERRVKSGRLSVTFPLGSRIEPESKREDWKDRIAVLQAYKVFGERLSEDAKKLGLLLPIDNPL